MFSPIRLLGGAQQSSHSVKPEIFSSPRTAIPGTSNTNTDGSAQHRTAQEPGFPPSGSVSAEQPGAVGDGDREGLSPNAAAPASERCIGAGC